MLHTFFKCGTDTSRVQASLLGYQERGTGGFNCEITIFLRKRKLLGSGEGEGGFNSGLLGKLETQHNIT
jgi:hypothetical protein